MVATGTLAEVVEVAAAAFAAPVEAVIAAAA